MENMSRRICRLKFRDNTFNYTNLNTEGKAYIKNEIQAIKSHPVVESIQKISWKNNFTGNIFNTEIININTITHNKSTNGIMLGYDKKNTNLYLNTKNMKMCNIKDKLENNGSIGPQDAELIKNEDIFIEKIDYEIFDWFQCMKTMRNNASKCYDIIFWKENNLQKIKFYINKDINTETILDGVELITTVYL